MTTAGTSASDHVDDHVDDEIASCLDLTNPKSFFLFAGAGSGKTRSLVKALVHLREKYRSKLQVRGQKLAVITYTNAACDEITRRLDFDPVFVISTIHSFAWTLIEGLNRDVKVWVRAKLAEDISELQALEAKGRPGTKASATRLNQIASKQRRLRNLDSIKRFIYSPTGDNRSRDSLNHAEVIAISAHFIAAKPTMQQMVVGAYPVILIDESQDTNELLVDALFKLQANHPQRLILGFLGDMMQRIYSDGKEGLGENLPSDWIKPVKIMNHRSSKRIVRLINKIRESVDRQSQEPSADAAEGFVRMFILSAETADKLIAERTIAETMARLTGDDAWADLGSCKRLILEHRMAARRMGFLDMFASLHEVESFRTGLLNGSLPTVRFFAEDIFSLVEKRDDKFVIARILRAKSPLLDKEALRISKDPGAILQQAREALASMLSLWADGGSPTFGEVLENVASSNLLYIPDVLNNHLRRIVTDAATLESEDGDRFAERAAAIDTFLGTKFEQIGSYASYVSGRAPFDTHQGVKGLEFPRVMVIMDDSEARGFMFKYEKLFGAGSQDDKVASGTRRLFYVTSSRAEHSLALVAYSTEPERVRRHVIAAGWFDEDEVHTGLVT